MSEASAPLSRRLVVEALGTAILVATVVGSGIIADRRAKNRRHASHQESVTALS